MDPMMMRNMMMARQMGGGPMGLKQSYGRPAPMNAVAMDANMSALQEQAQMMSNQYAPLAESQKVMGGLMAPQPNAMMAAPMDRAGLMAAMQARAAAPMEANMPVRERPGGRPADRLMQARDRMANKRVRGRMTPMAGRRNKKRRG